MKRSTFNFVSISMAFQYSARYSHQNLPIYTGYTLYSSPWSFSHHMNATKNCIHACFCHLIFTHITGLTFIYTCRIQNYVCLVNFFFFDFFLYFCHSYIIRTCIMGLNVLTIVPDYMTRENELLDIPITYNCQQDYV